MESEVNDSVIDSFIIEGLSKQIPLIDIFVLLTKQIKGIKKITVAHDPINYASNECICQVDFLNHEFYSIAKSTLKSPNLLNNLFNESDRKIKIRECKKFRNNLIDQTVNKTTALMFENLQVDHINILEFISYLKEYINTNNNSENENKSNNYKITKIRQYNNRVLVFFDSVPNCIKNLERKGENEYLEDIPYFNYKGKNIPVIPKMMPVTNLGKYKERNTKISIHCLNPEDKENLFKIFEKNKTNDENSEENDSIDDMAQKALNNIMNKEKNNRDEKMRKSGINRKREREKDNKNNEREKDRQRDRNRERDRSKDKKREREKDRKREKERDYERRNQKENEHPHERKNTNNNVRDDINNNNNMANNMDNNPNNFNNNTHLNGLNINEKDLNQVASLFSNANAMNIVKYLLENNMFNNISNATNNSNNNNINNNNLMTKKENNNNLVKNNYNDNFNNIYNQNNLNNMNNQQQLLNYIQSQGNLINKQSQQQRMNNILGNNLNNNYQNMMNLGSMMNMDNNMINPNFFNNQRQFPFAMNEQFMNQFGYNQQNKRRDNDNK